jgi:hypothetical protein
VYELPDVPAIDERWRVAPPVLARAWKARPALRLDEVLAPGVAARLAAWLPRLPVGIAAAERGRGVWWGCEVEAPPVIDPQIPPCVHQLVRFFDRDLPPLIAAITGRALVPAPPRRFGVRIWKMGSFLDERDAAPGAIEAVVGLTGARWPEDWGGTTEVLGERWPPGWNTLDLIGDTPRRIGLVTEHVEMITVSKTYASP